MEELAIPPDNQRPTAHFEFAKLAFGPDAKSSTHPNLLQAEVGAVSLSTESVRSKPLPAPPTSALNRRTHIHFVVFNYGHQELRAMLLHATAPHEHLIAPCKPDRWLVTGVPNLPLLR